MIDPNQQLLMARGLMSHPSAGFGGGQSSYISEVERNAAATSAGLLNVGAGAAVTLPFVAGGLAPMMLRGKGLSGKVGRSIGRGLSAFDPFGTAFEMFGKIGKGPGKIGLGAAAVGVAGAAASAYGIHKSVDFMRDQMLEGQRNFLATRTLMRSMPEMGGFGAQSVLSSAQSPISTPGQVSQLNASLRSIGGSHGMNMGQARNMMGSLGSMGMLNTGSVKQMSTSFRSSLKELQGIAKQIGGDIQEAVQTYQAIDRMGFKTSGARKSVLRQMTTTSGMTGASLGEVGQVMNMTMVAADQLGLSRSKAASLANKSMQTSAYMSSAGMMDNTYMQRAGGSVSAVAQRMAQIHMGTVQSTGGMALMSNLYGAGGDLSSKGFNRAMGGGRMRMKYRNLMNMDPYQMDTVREDLMGNMGGAILSRVGSIQSKFSKDPLKANRAQYKYMSSMGISDPREQLQYLSYLRATPGSAFRASMQDLRNTAVTSQDMSMRGPETGANALKNAIDRISSSLSTTFQRAGEALLRDWEGTNRRVSTAISGHQRTYGTGVADMADMKAVGLQVRRGQFNFESSNADVKRLLAGAGAERALSSSMNIRGADATMRRGMLGGVMAKGMFMAAGLSGGINNYINNLSSTLLDEPGAGLGRTSATGALAEGLGQKAISDGGIYLGMNRYGKRSYGNAGSYMQLMARDMGVEYDPATGKLLKTDMNKAAYLSATRGTTFGNMFNAGIGRGIGQQIEKRDYAFGGLGGAGAGALILGGAGVAAGMAFGNPLAALGLGAAGVVGGGLLGAGIFGGGRSFEALGLPKWSGNLAGAGLGAAMGTALFPGLGTALGAAGGWMLGGELLGGRGLKGALDDYSTKMGVATSTALTPGQRKALYANRDTHLNSKEGDALTGALFNGKKYSELEGNERLLFNEMLRRHGGEKGKALAGPLREGSLSTEGFNAIVVQEAGRTFAESMFEVGGQGSVARSQRLMEKGLGIDVGLAAAGMSPEERREVHAWSRVSNPLTQSSNELSEMYEQLRGIVKTGSKDRILESVSEWSPDQKTRMITRKKMTAYLDALSLTAPPEQRAELDQVRARMDKIIADPSVLGSQNQRFVSSAKEAVQAATSRGRLFKGLTSSQNVLSEGMLTEDRSRVRTGALKQTAGLTSALSVLADTFSPTDSGVHPDTMSKRAQLESAIRTVSGKKYFSTKEREAALGSLVALHAQNAADSAEGGGVYEDFFDSSTKALVAKGALRQSDADTLDFTVISPESASFLQDNINSLDAEAKNNLRGSADDQARAAILGARLSFMDAQNNQIRSVMSEALRKQAPGFAAFLADLSSNRGIDSANMTTAQKAASNTGKNILSQLRTDKDSAGVGFSRLKDQLRAKLKDAKGPDKKRIHDDIKRLSSFERMMSPDADDFSALASMGVQGGIRSDKGKFTIDDAAIMRGMSTWVHMDPTKTGAILASEPIKAIRRLLKGGRGAMTESDLIKVAGAKGLEGADKIQAVLGTFGRKGGGEAGYQKLIQEFAGGKGPSGPGGEARAQAAQSALTNNLRGYIGGEEQGAADKKATQNSMKDSLTSIVKLLQGGITVRPTKPITGDKTAPGTAPTIENAPRGGGVPQEIGPQ